MTGKRIECVHHVRFCCVHVVALWQIGVLAHLMAAKLSSTTESQRYIPDANESNYYSHTSVHFKSWGAIAARAWT